MRGGHHNYPYANTQEATKRRKADADPLLGEDGEQDDGGEEEEEGEDVTKDKMIKVSTRGGGEGSGMSEVCWFSVVCCLVCWLSVCVCGLWWNAAFL